MKRLIFKIILPILLITFWLKMAYSLSIIDGELSYFRYWIIAGLPFGIKYMTGATFAVFLDLQECLIAVMISILLGGLLGGFALIGKIFNILQEIMLFILLDLFGSHVIITDERTY